MREVKDEPRHISVQLFQRDFLFLVPFYKICSILPRSRPEFFNKHFLWAQLSAGAEQGVYTCALGSRSAAQVGDGPGRGNLECAAGSAADCDHAVTVATSFVLPDFLFDPAWF